MKTNRLSKFIIFAMTVVILLFSLLFFITGNSEWRHRTSSLSQSAMGFVTSVIRVPYVWTSDVVNQFQDLLNTYQENLILKQTLTELESQADMIADLEKDNENLRAQLNIQEQYKPTFSIRANLLSRSTLSWLDFAQVDQGSSDGVEENMLLVSSNGVLGVVSQVTPFSAQVELLTNTKRQQPISVQIKTDKETVYGILSEYDAQKKLAIVTQLNQQVDLSQNLSVSTSGLDGFSQSDLPIGKVASTEKGNDQALTVYVDLAADLEDNLSLSLVGR